MDKTNNKIKVKQSNLLQEFSASEAIHSNIITMSGSANGYIYATSLPFQSNTMSGNVTTASSTVTAITPSSFIAEKNAFTQNPIVRLYSIYYPGEWYPPNANGNPTGQGAGFAWPHIFPLRFAEIVGDIAEDISYNVSYDGISYVPYPVNVSGLEQASDGKINELSLTVYNTDNIISYLVENPYLAGINTSNSVSAIVNGELVAGIDPNTVVGSDSYDSTVVAYYGMSNAAFDKTRTDAVGGTWQQQKMDTRDLLGAAVEIKTTFANFLDYWPEHGLIKSGSNATLEVTNTLPYRVGDVVRLRSNSYTKATITSIDSDNSVSLDEPLVKYFYLGSRDNNSQSITFNNDGTKMYMLGSSNDRVNEYNLSNTWDVSTAQYLQNVHVGTLQSGPTGMRFDPTGSYMFIVGSANANIHRYTLSTAWDVTTASLTQSFDIGSYNISPSGLAIDVDGANVFVTSSNNTVVNQFNLAIGWNLGTASFFASKNLGPGSTRDIEISPDSSKLFITSSTGDRLVQFDMGDLANISSATESGNVYLGFFDTTMTSIAFDDVGSYLYVGGIDTDNVYQIPLSSFHDINTIDYTSSFINEPLYISNPQADTSSYLIDNYKIDQLEGLSENVATFGLVSWLQYFKIVTPKRKYYKNTCQWKYKGDECQYPGPGGLLIPGTTPAKYSPNYTYDVNNQPSFQLAPSLINTDSWTVGTSSLTDYTAYGDGNSRLVDSTPYGDLGVIWDISNQDSASNADGGWNPGSYNFTVDQTKMYRFSVWARRKVVGNGTNYFKVTALDSSLVNIGVLNRTDGSTNTDAKFYSGTWWGINRTWYLLVGHVWSAGSSTGAVYSDTGIYDISGSKITTASDFVWQNVGSMKTGLAAQLYGSTDTTTNQQFYNPRIDILNGAAPTIQDLLSSNPAAISSRLDQDVCAKSLAACTLRNNSIHFGGFPGVGRTVPQM